MAQQQQQQHPIFHDIKRGGLEAVQQRVLADAAVLEERKSRQVTPLMYAILTMKPAIALWLPEHRGQHDLETADCDGWTALHLASERGPLKVLQALLAAGANLATLNKMGLTPLMSASINGSTDVAAFLLQLPAVKTSIDHVSQGLDEWTALSCASRLGHQPIVQLLLDAGADPTLPSGQRSPVDRALSNNCRAIAALIRDTIAEAERGQAFCRALHKARSLFGAGAASLACLQARVERGEALPQLGFVRRGRSRNEELQGAAAFAVGVSGGEKGTALCEELYVELLGSMLPAWADKGPAGV